MPMKNIIYHGVCRPESVIQGARYRFTILTSRLIRIEYSKKGCFEDRPSQLAINRDFDTPLFSVRDEPNCLEIHTKHLSLYYDKKEFSAGGLAIKVRSASRGIYSTWHYSDELKENLGGTVRTLDQVDGETALNPGIQSRLQGYSVLDDSKSLLFGDNQQMEPRLSGNEDLYFFGYGYQYQKCLQDFFHLSGKTPLLPRYAFGNWWSRFYPYTAKEYSNLMMRFAQERVPLSVAVIDMNWHITDVNPEEGKGWTGYTWDLKLIPEPKALLNDLHRRKLKVTLNLHPADGVQAHEAQYPLVASDLGRDADAKVPIPFDFCNPAFIETYFNRLIYPLEEDGVDFWWIDWQQEMDGRIPGSDPLWLLNHFHFLDSGKGDRRPMILSRYAGAGSHRYPIGFSGDSVISWASLHFQPYLTATAANIGFAWWSHDIGGHCGGKKDAELMTRWVQFGVFSPIMRLHSTSNLFNGKEPWKFNEPAQSIIKRFLRLRHQLIPYLYSLNWKCHSECVLPVRPMYYRYPENDEAYEVNNQYLFGDNLIVNPITAPADAETGLGHTVIWLPDGIFYDCFSGVRYIGGRKLNAYRSIEFLPVFASAGAIIPMTDEDEASNTGTALPTKLDVYIFNGSNGSFILYEDDGESMAYQEGAYVCTKFDFNYSEATFSVIPDTDPFIIRPEKRQYSFHFYGIQSPLAVEVTADGTIQRYEQSFEADRNRFTIVLKEIDSKRTILIRFLDALSMAKNNIEQTVYCLLDQMNIKYEEKEAAYHSICHAKEPWRAISELQALHLPQDVINALSEVLLAD